MKKIEPNPLLGPEVLPSDELYRILFSNLERRIGERAVRSIAVTSSVKGEGKTTTIIQLAKVGVRDFGKKILLLEGDFKNPQLTFLSKDPQQSDKAIGETSIKGLDVLTLSNITKNKQMNGPAFANGLRKVIETVSGGYDYIFVDSPPILPLVDMQIIASVVDGVLMVVRYEGPSRDLVIRAMNALPKEKLLGAVFNGVQSRWPKYGREYSYY